MTAAKKIELPNWPRLMEREQAASYCSVSVNHFIAHFPYEPTRMGGKKLYDIRVLDEWIDTLSGRKDDDENWLRLLDDPSPKERA